MGMKSVRNLSNMSREELMKECIKLNTQIVEAKAKLEWYEEQFKLRSSQNSGKARKMICAIR